MQGNGVVGMERRVKEGAGVGAEWTAILIILAMVGGVGAPRAYSCWGSCYNDCFVASGKEQPGRFSCEYQCLDSCIPRSPTDLHFYCQIGCSIKRCIPVALDGEKMEGCLEWCDSLCDKIIAP